MATFLSIEAKRIVDNSNKVVAAMDKATRRNLFRSGAVGMREMRGLIRKSKSHSNPGQPPNSQTGTLKRTIFFFVDGANEVIWGPIGLGANAGMATGALEHGGISKSQNGLDIRIDQRPFVRPGFQKARDKMAQFWSEGF